MPPISPLPQNTKPWSPINKNVAAPPTSEANPDLKKYYEAKQEWKDSTPLYRHINPRPETWIPRKIVDTDYRIPTAAEKEKKRLEYLDIVEEIKDQIPPEYYKYWHDFYSRPVNFENEGPDRTGAVDGYKPTMFSHPRFFEKDHSKYHALPREKMFPEDESLYKLQETHKVKESLDVLEDDGMDYEERMWKAKREAQQKQIENEKTLREEVMRGTHWIDWDSDNEEMSHPKDWSRHDRPRWNPERASRSMVADPIGPDFSEHLSHNVEPMLDAPQSPVQDIIKGGKKTGMALASKALGFVSGMALCGAVYGIWKLFGTKLRKSKTDAGRKVRRDNVRRWKTEQTENELSARAWNCENFEQESF
jgi:hypothetical protein